MICTICDTEEYDATIHIKGAYLVYMYVVTYESVLLAPQVVKHRCMRELCIFKTTP